MISPLADKPIDMHVHIVGNGTGGTGCWLRVRGLWHRPLASLMLHFAGLPMSALKGDMDGLYIAKLLDMVRNSSLGAIVILAHENVYDDSGKIMEGAGSFYVPNDYVLKLARMHKEFLSAVSIHPARPDALEELERCLNGGAVMMKCLPNCHNIDCNKPRYKKFWERMAEAKLPLLAHTGGEHTVPVIRKELADPRCLTLPLECGVTVVAAHCATKSGAFDADYFDTFVEMTRKYPNLYGDNSALNQVNRCKHLRDCAKPSIADRILHGSDFPVPILGHGAWMRGFIDWKSFRRWQRHPNMLERDYQLKLAMGFPKECFTRVRGLLRLPTTITA